MASIRRRAPSTTLRERPKRRWPTSETAGLAMSIAQKSRRRRSWRSRTPSGSKRKLGADEAGNPRIEGKHGGVYGQPLTCGPANCRRYGGSELRPMSPAEPHEAGTLLLRLPLARQTLRLRDLSGRHLGGDSVAIRHRIDASSLSCTGDFSRSLKMGRTSVKRPLVSQTILRRATCLLGLVLRHAARPRQRRNSQYPNPASRR
jgi:hypothetical protein